MPLRAFTVVFNSALELGFDVSGCTVDSAKGTKMTRHIGISKVVFLYHC